MPWECKLLDVTGTKHVERERSPDSCIVGETCLVDTFGTTHSFRSLPIGTMFHLPYGVETREWPWSLAKEHKLSDYYRQNNHHRNPLFIRLPGKVLFCLDSKAWNSVHYHGGWTVTGDAPNITVTPSINAEGVYHGFLTNGVLSDDVEGRQFS